MVVQVCFQWFRCVETDLPSAVSVARLNRSGIGQHRAYGTSDVAMPSRMSLLADQSLREPEPGHNPVEDEGARADHVDPADLVERLAPEQLRAGNGELVRDDLI